MKGTNREGYERKKNSYQLVIVNNRNHTFYSCIKSEIQKPAKNKIFRDKSICEKIIFIEKKNKVIFKLRQAWFYNKALKIL